MKIAVCFFGITRKLKEHTLESIEQCLLAPVAQRDPSYKKFGHFNLVHQISNPRTGEENIPVDPHEYKLLQCDLISHTDQDRLDAGFDCGIFEKFGDAWEDNFSSLRNLLRQLHSLNQVTELLIQARQQFDLVIYSRVDLGFEGKVEIPRVRPGTLYTPWFSKSGGLNDRFAMGDFATMVKYGQRGSTARQYCQETGRPLHAERFLSWYARKHGMHTVDLTSIGFHRVRANGTVPSWDATMRTRLRHRCKRALSRLKNLALGHNA